jgi:hypothetical protein
MYCGGCGTPNPEGNNFCKQCGRVLIQPTESKPQIAGSKDTDSPEEVRSMAHPATIIIAICSFLVVILLVLLVTQDKTTTKTQQTTSTEAKPIVDDATLHPYDLFKNPYSHKNHVVALNAEAWPMLYNGQLLRYIDGGSVRVGFGYSGLHFTKMLDERTAVYDIMGMEASGHSDFEMLGQLAVQGSPSGELDVARMWDVEPLGSLEGSNALGGTVTVPAVRFWGYTDQRNASQINQTEAQLADQRNASQNNQTGTQLAEAIKPSPLSGDSLVVQNLVRSKIRPTQFLLNTQPDFSHSEWQIVDTQTVYHGCWYATYYINVKNVPKEYYSPYGHPAVYASWKVNLRTQTVTPSTPDTAKLFDISQ